MLSFTQLLALVITVLLLSLQYVRGQSTNLLVNSSFESNSTQSNGGGTGFNITGNHAFAPWVVTGGTPDICENADQPLLPLNPANYGHQMYLNGWTNNTTRCYENNFQNPIHNDFDTPFGQYYIGMGGCEGLIQNLNNNNSINSNVIITISFSYSARCVNAFNTPIAVGVGTGINFTNNCNFTSTYDTTIFANTSGAQVGVWNNFQVSYRYTDDFTLNQFFILIPTTCPDNTQTTLDNPTQPNSPVLQDNVGMRSVCYYYIDNVQLTVTPLPFFELGCGSTCSRCAQRIRPDGTPLQPGDPEVWVDVPNAVGSQSPFVLQTLWNVHECKIEVWDQWGNRIFNGYWGDQNCWPPGGQNQIGYYPGWDFRDANGDYYPNDAYVVRVQAWGCCSNSSHVPHFDYTATVTKVDNPPPYYVKGGRWSWFPSDCCLRDLTIEGVMLTGKPRYVVGNLITIRDVGVQDEPDMIAELYFQAPNINLVANTVGSTFNSRPGGNAVLIAAPCTVNPSNAYYGCTDVPMRSGKRSFTEDTVPVPNAPTEEELTTTPMPTPVQSAPPKSKRPAERPFEVFLYPNPAQNRLYLRVSNGAIDITHVDIYSVHGSLVHSQPNPVKDDGAYSLSIGHLSSGVYVVSYTVADVLHRATFVKQ